MGIILLITLILIFGYLVVQFVARDLSFSEKTGLSFLLGIGLSTFLTFVFSWIGLKITFEHEIVMISILITLLSVLLLWNNKWNFGKAFNLYHSNSIGERLSIVEAILLLLILAIIAFGIVFNLYFPVREWDALGLYDFRAKIIAQEGYFVQVALAKGYDYFAHYPLLTSLGHTFVYVSGASNPQFLYSLYTISFALVYYGLLRRFVSRTLSLIGVLMLISNHFIFEHTIIAYANLPYAALIVPGFLYLYLSLIDRRSDYVILGSLLVGLSAWTRQEEPFWLVGILLAAFISMKRKDLTPFIKYLIPFLIIQQTWRRFLIIYFGARQSTTNQIVISMKAIVSTFDVSKFNLVVGYLFNNVVVPWGPIFLLFFVILMVDIKRGLNFKKIILLGVMIANFALVILGTLAFSVRFQFWEEIPGSASRMAIFFVPLMIYYIICSVNEVLAKEAHK